MIDITEVFTQYLEQYDSVDIAESEFKKQMHEDPELRTAYRTWCHEVGSSEKEVLWIFARSILTIKTTSGTL